MVVAGDRNTGVGRGRSGLRLRHCCVSSNCGGTEVPVERDVNGWNSINPRISDGLDAVDAEFGAVLAGW
jgi:hypothetical protein